MQGGLRPKGRNQIWPRVSWGATLPQSDRQVVRRCCPVRRSASGRPQKFKLGHYGLVAFGPACRTLGEERGESLLRLLGAADARDGAGGELAYFRGDGTARQRGV